MYYTGIRVSEGGYRQNVRDEVPRQETYKNEAGRDFGAQRKDYALARQHRGEWLMTSYLRFGGTSDHDPTSDVDKLIVFYLLPCLITLLLRERERDSTCI